MDAAGKRDLLACLNQGRDDLLDALGGVTEEPAAAADLRAAR